jgi:hypothetical protein
LAETVVLSTGEGQEKVVDPPFKKGEGEEEEALEKTVVISPVEAFKDSSRPSRKLPLGKTGTKEKEVPSKVSTTAKRVKKTAEEPPDEDFVAETIFLSPDKQDRDETDE